MIEIEIKLLTRLCVRRERGKTMLRFYVPCLRGKVMRSLGSWQLQNTPDIKTFKRPQWFRRFAAISLGTRRPAWFSYAVPLCLPLMNQVPRLGFGDRSPSTGND